MKSCYDFLCIPVAKPNENVGAFTSSHSTAACMRKKLYLVDPLEGNS